MTLSMFQALVLLGEWDGRSLARAKEDLARYARGLIQRAFYGELEYVLAVASTGSEIEFFCTTGQEASLLYSLLNYIFHICLSIFTRCD